MVGGVAYHWHDLRLSPKNAVPCIYNHISTMCLEQLQASSSMIFPPVRYSKVLLVLVPGRIKSSSSPESLQTDRCKLRLNQLQMPFYWESFECFLRCCFFFPLENPAMSVDLSATTATEASNEVQCLHTLDSEHVLPPPSKEFSNEPLKLCLKKSKKIATHPRAHPRQSP